MLQVGDKYHKDGIIYEVKEFVIEGDKIRLQLLDTTTNQPLAVNTTVVSFVMQYSKLPKGEIQLIN